MTEEEFNDLRNRVTLLENLKKQEMFWNIQRTTKIPCLWKNMPETSPGSGIKIGWLSCPCPKCTPRY